MIDSAKALINGFNKTGKFYSLCILNQLLSKFYYIEFTSSIDNGLDDFSSIIRDVYETIKINGTKTLESIDVSIECE